MAQNEEQAKEKLRVPPGGMTKMCFRQMIRVSIFGRDDGRREGKTGAPREMK